MVRLSGDSRGLLSVILGFLIILAIDASIVGAGQSVSLLSTDAPSAAELKLNQEIDSLFTLLGSKSNDAGARWTLANDLEFGGRAKDAIAHYKWIVDSGSAYGVTSSRIADARTHLITCRFLSQVRKKNEPATSEDVSVSPPVVTKPSQQETKTTAASQYQMTKQAGAMETDTAQVRKEFGFLKELTASVAVAGGLGAAGADDKVIQSALGLLYQWIDAPASGEPEARNRLVAGMVNALASIIVEKNLGIKVNSLMASQGQYAPVEALPDAGFASEMETEFESAPSSSEKRYEVGDGLIIIEKAASIDLTGNYDCEEFHVSANPSWTCSGTNELSVSTEVRIVQTGNVIEYIAKTTASIPGGNSEAHCTGTLVNNVAELTCQTSTKYGKATNTARLEVLPPDRIKLTVTNTPYSQYSIWRRR